MRSFLKFAAICNFAFWIMLFIHFNVFQQAQRPLELDGQSFLSTILVLGLLGFLVNIVANLYTARLLYKKQKPTHAKWLLVFNGVTFVVQIVYLLS